MVKDKMVIKSQIQIETMAAMLLLIVLASLTMLLISSTGKSYNNFVKTGGNSQNIRTTLLFVATKTREAGSGKNISVVSAPWGGNALVISQQDDNAIYQDWIFFYKGTLRESLIPKGTEINLFACQNISNLSSFSLSLKGNSLDISAGESGWQAGKPQSLILTLRS